MLSFIVRGAVLDGPSTNLLGLSHVEFLYVDGAWTIVAASEADSALTTFGFENNLVTGVLDQQGYTSTSGTRTVWDLTVLEMGGVTHVLPATRYEDQTNFYAIGGNGVLSGGLNPNGIGELSLNTAVTVGGNTFVYTSGTNGSGLNIYGVDSNLDFTMVDQIADTGTTYLGDVSALTSATVGGVTYLFAASAYDTGISSYEVGTDGTLTLADSVTPGEYSGFWRVQELVSMVVEGQTFVVMASAGTSSLTVYSVAADGSMVETDHFIDSLDTRFQDAAVLETFEYDGRSFVIAAGSDDGITVLELTTAGTLWEHASFADTYDITLANITAISAEVINGAVEILVSSGTDHGFTHLTLDTSQLDSAITGTQGNDYLRGSSSADVIYGLDGDDLLEGRGGADIMVDGAGRDTLTGDGGRDVFMFVEDGEPDVITDYGVGFDQIDVSQFADVHGMSDLRISDWCGGVIIIANQDTIIIQNQPDRIYEASEFGFSEFIF